MALEEWHTEIPSYRIPAETTFLYHGGMVFALDELPVEWGV